MKRGEVYWVAEYDTSGSEIKKNRPWVVIGADPINKARDTVISIPFSRSAIQKLPISVEVEVKGKVVVAVCDQIRGLDKRRFSPKPIASLSAHDIKLIEGCLSQVLALG